MKKERKKDSQLFQLLLLPLVIDLNLLLIKGWPQNWKKWLSIVYWKNKIVISVGERINSKENIL